MSGCNWFKVTGDVTLRHLVRTNLRIFRLLAWLRLVSIGLDRFQSGFRVVKPGDSVLLMQYFLLSDRMSNLCFALWLNHVHSLRL